MEWTFSFPEITETSSADAFEMTSVCYCPIDVPWVYMNHIMRKPVYAICEQQRRRPACASTQSDQRLCCSLTRLYNISSFYIYNFMSRANFCSRAGRFESYLVTNPEDRFSYDEANIRNLQGPLHKTLFLVF